MLNVQPSRRQGILNLGRSMTARTRGSFTHNVGPVDAEQAPAYGLQWADNQHRKLEVCMTRRVLALPAAIAIIAAVLLLRFAALAQSPAGQAAPVSSSDAKSKAAVKPWTPPRTPWGRPDLQGIWDYRTITPLERPSALSGKQFLTDDEA